MSDLYEHVVVDIETLGVGADAVILSIGACGVGVDGVCKMEERFQAVITVQSNLGFGRVIDEKTVMWHFDNEERIEALAGERSIEKVSLREALKLFVGYIEGPLFSGTVKVWAKSPTFDLVILRHAIEQCEMEVPWSYWQERDIRSLDIFHDYYHEWMEDMVHPAHVSVVDAYNEAKILHKALQWVAEKKNRVDEGGE